MFLAADEYTFGGLVSLQQQDAACGFTLDKKTMPRFPIMMGCVTQSNRVTH